jgi:hypothetical protein
MVGPALPQALRPVRYLPYDPDGNFRETDDDDPDTMTTTFPEEQGPGGIRNKKLEENSRVADTVEDILSLTCVAPHYPPHSLYFIVVL